REQDGQRTFAVVTEGGDKGLQTFAVSQSILAAELTAVRAFESAVVLYFDWDGEDYLRIPGREQVEVDSLIGDIAQPPSGEPALHIHLVVGKCDGDAMAGRHVRPTLKAILTESPAHLRKVKDPETGLALIEARA